MGLPEEAGTAADGDHSIPHDTSIAGGGAAGKKSRDSNV